MTLNCIVRILSTIQRNLESFKVVFLQQNIQNPFIQQKLSMNKIILLLLIIFSIQGLSQTTELKLVSDVWPPFTNIEGKKAFAIDLVTEALNRININTKIEIVVSEDILKGINSGDFDGSAALWINEERKKKYLFSDPYLHNQLILVGKKGSNVSATSFLELSGNRIGIIENYVYGIDESGAEKINFVRGSSDQQNLERLLSDQIDYMLVDALLIQYLLKFQVNDVSEYLEIGPAHILAKSLHFALDKNVPDAQKIMTLFNEEIQKMIADGSYHSVLELNWIQADLDGDGKMEIILNCQTAGKEEPRNVYNVYTSLSPGYQGTTAKGYYIVGNYYSCWDDIPQQYKNEIIMGSQSIEGTGIKLNFK